MASVGVCTRPMDKSALNRRVKARLAFMPTSQSAWERQAALRYWEARRPRETETETETETEAERETLPQATTPDATERDEDGLHLTCTLPSGRAPFAVKEAELS